ncbi:hypothetical protein SAMN02910298_00663 [Pseudobutyrivibrio sp. YE44]|uniref:hypothetical protein n=1 Tax=Pseudobutyrivibrio sp. YE44 TaxID=1520802 RepID=UPI0008823FBE|nr:hypothetical protein [Pseudobutyrivibrio sp. YE44]SDB12806.1 hypothetical protein SAMN02910298_00663 [Pseudobutyrivibrio sp. YE44]
MKENNNIDNKKDDELTFWQFLCKHGFFVIIVGCLIPFVMNYIKNGVFSFEELPISFLVALGLCFCAWKASRIKL